MKTAYLLVFSLLLVIAPKTAARCPGKDSLPDDKVFRVLLDHNVLRSWAAEGFLTTGERKLPPGENIYSLEYSCEMEELAKAAVKGCPTTNAVNPHYGQNFVHYNATVPEEKEEEPLLSALYYWPNTASEFEDIGSDVVELKNEKARDLANILRADTLFVGCAEEKCGNIASAACFYSKPDVQLDELVYKAGSNCLQGGKCTTYPNSSCEPSYSLCKMN